MVYQSILFIIVLLYVFSCYKKIMVLFEFFKSKDYNIKSKTFKVCFKIYHRKIASSNLKYKVQ